MPCMLWAFFKVTPAIIKPLSMAELANTLVMRCCAHTGCG